MDEYIEKAYLKIEDINKEKASTIQELLESELLEGKTKNDIIEKGFDGKIKSMNKIKEYSVAESLLSHNKIEVSWQTIIDFTVWEDYSFDLIVEFINSNENYKILSINDLYDNYGNYFDEEKEFYDFAYKLISNLRLKAESFKSIFEDSTSLKLNTSSIKVDFKLNMSNDKSINAVKELRILYLIEKDYIELNKKEYNYFIDNDKKTLINLIEKFENKFIEEISTYDFEIDFLENLLNSSISTNNKFLIINNKEDLIIDDNDIESHVAYKIIDMFITSNYTNYSASLFNKLISRIDDEIKKIEFFNFYFKQKDSNVIDIEEILESMGEKFQKIINQENITFESNEINKEFLDILKSFKYVSNYRRRKDNLFINY